MSFAIARTIRLTIPERMEARKIVFGPLESACGLAIRARIRVNLFTQKQRVEY